MTHLFFDARDEGLIAGDRRIAWLCELGAEPLPKKSISDEGFLFAGARSIEDYRALVRGHALLHDRAEDREPLLRLDSVLEALALATVNVPTPRTWRLELDAPLPGDLSFPLFLRTPLTSWKLGGRISRVRNARELDAECSELRRAFGWDSPILAREWVELASCGQSPYGPVAREVRVWIVDGRPHA